MIRSDDDLWAAIDALRPVDEWVLGELLESLTCDEKRGDVAAADAGWTAAWEVPVGIASDGSLCFCTSATPETVGSLRVLRRLGLVERRPGHGHAEWRIGEEGIVALGVLAAVDARNQRIASVDSAVRERALA